MKAFKIAQISSSTHAQARFPHEPSAYGAQKKRAWNSELLLFLWSKRGGFSRLSVEKRSVAVNHVEYSEISAAASLTPTAKEDFLYANASQ